MKSLSFISDSPTDTENLGRELGALLPKGSFVALHGELGSGKTCFTRGLVSAVAPQSLHLVASPTFAIMNTYPGIRPVYHFDFYRLSGENEIFELGFEEYLQGDGICIAEWSERLGNLLPRDHLSITFKHADQDSREIFFTALGSEAEELLARLAKLEKIVKISLT
ncbi:MAG TPA: tRNA (adenosine(37)-N6)-threonylcarbamoyltransferase complex ATPase subunit type 1 TsaE [Desulfuromonadaceae bacterium]|jgi:tRNA threonylcarbamoyladenosine biosynthesis protein TsaE